MACSQRLVVAQSRRPGSPIHAISQRRRRQVLLVAGVFALLGTACGNALGGGTPCSAYLSMDNSDQQSTITTMFQDYGQANLSSDDVTQAQRSASTYCSDPLPGIDTIDGMLDSRPS